MLDIHQVARDNEPTTWLVHEPRSMNHRHVFCMFFALAIGAPNAASADTLYLCKSYSGGSFWASSHCNRHNALIDRMISVPDGLPFSQQVAIGQQSLNNTTKVYAPPTPSAAAVIRSAPEAGSERECDALQDRISTLDSMRHEIRPPISRDQIAAQKQAAQNRRSRLGCR